MAENKTKGVTAIRNEAKEQALAELGLDALGYVRIEKGYAKEFTVDNGETQVVQAVVIGLTAANMEGTKPDAKRPVSPFNLAEAVAEYEEIQREKAAKAAAKEAEAAKKAEQAEARKAAKAKIDAEKESAEG